MTDSTINLPPPDLHLWTNGTRIGAFVETKAWSEAAVRAAILADRAQRAEAQEPDEAGWMIECSHGFTGWWDGRIIQGMVDCRFFNTDPNKGVRFARREDAERVIKSCGNSCQIATGHSWISNHDAPKKEKPE